MRARFYRAGALILLIVLTAPITAHTNDANLESYFREFAGCALVVTRDRYDERRIEYRPEQCRQSLSPCSTFKIPNALIGLETGAVSGPGDLKAWDGVQRSREVNNQDHTLASAIGHSVVWYFQQIARDVGSKAMQDWLDRLEYGNRDISGGIDRFWLGSTLRIDAYTQLDLIQSLWRSQLPFKLEHQVQLREMLLQESQLPGALHGKTGSCRGDPDLGTPDHGWFIGWIDWDKHDNAGPATTWFVVNIMGKDAWGWNAKRITLALLEGHP